LGNLRLEKINDDVYINQYDEGFCFGTDAVLLASYVNPKAESEGVEFGTGSGIIPILLGIHKEFKKIYSFEIQNDYYVLAKDNIEKCNLSDKIEVINDDLKNAHKNLKKEVEFVFSNPPYLKNNSGFMNENEKKLIARHEIYCDIDDICRAANSVLKFGGDFYVIYRPERLVDLFCAMRKYTLEPKDLIYVCPRPNSIPSLFLCRAKKGAKSELKVHKPLLLSDESGNMSEEYKVINEFGVFKR